MPEIVSLARARVRGLLTYNDGKPCIWGHGTERFTVGSKCVICRKVRRNMIRILKADEKRALARRWYANNKQKVLEKNRRWRERNTEKLKDFETSRRVTSNPDRKIQMDRSRHAYRAKKLNQLGIISLDIIDRLLEKQDYECAYSIHWCKADFLFEKFHIDHIMPLALGGLHEDSNLQLLCKKCNLSKGAKHPDTFEGLNSGVRNDRNVWTAYTVWTASPFDEVPSTGRKVRRLLCSLVESYDGYR